MRERQRQAQQPVHSGPPDELLTASEVGAILKLSPDTVTRRFSPYVGRPGAGVYDLGSEGSLKQRRYRILRIRRYAVDAFLNGTLDARR